MIKPKVRYRSGSIPPPPLRPTNPRFLTLFVSEISEVRFLGKLFLFPNSSSNNLLDGLCGGSWKGRIYRVSSLLWRRMCVWGVTLMAALLSIPINHLLCAYSWSFLLHLLFSPITPLFYFSPPRCNRRSEAFLPVHSQP